MDEIVRLTSEAYDAVDHRAASDAAKVSWADAAFESPKSAATSGLLFVSPSGPVSVAIRSTKPDNVAKQIERKLKEDAKHQFSTGRPSVLFVQVSDLNAEQLAALESSDADGANKVRRMASRILRSCEHLSAVSLTTCGQPVAEIGPGDPIGDRLVSYNFSRLSIGDPAADAVERATRGPDAVLSS